MHSTDERPSIKLHCVVNALISRLHLVVVLLIERPLIEVPFVGHLLLAGSLGDPPTGGALVFADVDADHVRSFAESDPYMRAGLIKEYQPNAPEVQQVDAELANPPALV